MNIVTYEYDWTSNSNVKNVQLFLSPDNENNSKTMHTQHNIATQLSRRSGSAVQLKIFHLKIKKKIAK